MTQRLLCCGDNLTVLRDQVDDASVDLVYLDPPFNTGRDRADAFSDTWTWDAAADHAWRETVASGGVVGRAVTAFRDLLGDGDMTAYLVMMAPRLVELRRAMKPTASVYLHCDPTSSHYLKVLMDAVFGTGNFRREVVWRSGWVSGFKAATRNWARNHDVLLYYVRDHTATWTFDKALAYRPHDAAYRRRGGGANPNGVALDDVWTDAELVSPWIKSFSTEKRGWPTQKPVRLLERIVAVSSRQGDVVLDPFCGSGTTLVAAEGLGRAWIGIDMSAAAIALTRERLADASYVLG